MPEAEQTKVCPLCAENIKAAAKICPCCQTRQNRFLISGGGLLVPVAYFAVIGILIMALGWTFGGPEGPDSGFLFGIHRKDLAVQNMSWGKNGGDANYWVSGTITNTGKYSWRIQQLEVRINDDQNSLVDVQHVELDKADKFVVLPGQEHAFKISFYSQLLTTNSKPVVRVQTAMDGRARYNPD